MNKEELRQYSAKLMADNITLMEDNKILMNRIDKAIKYIENKEKELEEIKGYDLLGNDYWHFNTKLLEILKGSDKEC